MKRNLRNLLVLILLLPVIISGQARQNAVETSLAGTYTVHGRGVDVVGWNPANLGFAAERPFSWSIMNINGGVHNNAFSIVKYNNYSGQNLEVGNRKANLLNSISNNGWRWTVDIHSSVPAVSFSMDNWAFTSDLLLVNDMSIPKDIFNFVFLGNSENDSLVFDFTQETLALGMHSFSFAIPFEGYSIGISLKYLNGFYYSGLQYQEGSLQTTPEAITGVLQYREREAVGGNGVAVDLGVTTEEFEHWQFGLAVNNIGGRMYWGDETPTAKFVSGVFGAFLPIKEVARTTDYFYGLDSLNGEKLYVSSFNDLVVDSTDRSVGTGQFSIKYPTLLRMGGSYYFRDQYTKVMMDFRAGFQDRFFTVNRWIWSAALEWRRQPWFPVRTGIAWDGSDYTQWGLGFGVETELLEFNFGMSFDRGMWIHTLQGLTVSLGITYRVLPE
ncbi:MAG: hypothetical protein MAGBODY4_01387 [Candidatus Marinimicrobia bacterium]|nr:hypothetical protein [Candidatus Neomarinimicrobiota bacterium]